MNWPTTAELCEVVPPPPGYGYSVPSAADVPRVVRALHEWAPAMAVGNASCFLREDFYTGHVNLQGSRGADYFVLQFTKGSEWAGMLAVERDRDAQVLYGRVGVIGVPYRGTGLASTFAPLMEAMGVAMGLGMVYGLATLQVPYMQQAFEKAGWQLVGIMPGFDRELVQPAVIKRVFEAIYAKVLVPDSEILYPSAHGMTRSTHRLFDLLYGMPMSDCAPATLR
jgi:hypothetical protein